MTVLGIGIDILSLSRFHGVIARRGVDRVARRVCCDRELAEFRRIPVSEQRTPSIHDPTSPSSSPSPSSQSASSPVSTDSSVSEAQLRFLSSRWAIKEAGYKALTPSLPLLRTLQPDFLLSFHSFDLVHSRGVPSLHLLRSTRTPSSTKSDRMEGINMVSSISHDAGVVVGVVLASKA